jgi:hypothetical protein
VDLPPDAESSISIVVTGRLTRDELLAGIRFATWARSTALGYAGIVTVIVGFAAGSVLDRNHLPPLGAFLGVLVWLALAPNIALRKQLQMFPYLLEEGTYRFTVSNFAIERPSLRVTSVWTNVQNVLEMRDRYAIFIARRAFYSIPKRFFTPEQLAQLDGLFRSALAAHGKPAIKRASAFWEVLCYRKPRSRAQTGNSVEPIK